ncbi:PQQ-binding-like beta-propeller repeat protein [Paenibacillus sp. FSL K6-3166]|uniref:outer membrane protein assembly factor BamB family protein n=1 Tax=unclassified Paenibacillus TaxID=185978 RepID=UPI000BA079B2|nr:PQQ-binding-like beta-propeller repeat protein [Paenibacillus sp. VTT E-133291]MBY3618558.1 PQQ-binding-like beta-propeller repeat protein [Acinetobacter sp. CUI P1]OZQ97273.1 hypothetical protein CA598_06870 [Paenibacillus sp. VTT E-133291]
MVKKIITGLFVALLCLFIVFPNRMFADPSYRYNFPGNDTIREMSVTKDGTAYGVFLSGDRGKLVSFSKDGKVNWSIYGPHHEEMYMTTDGKGRVYTAIGAKVTAYDTLGKVRWTKKFSESVNIVATKEIFIAYMQSRVQAFTLEGKSVYDVKFSANELKIPSPDIGYGIWSVWLENTMDVYKKDRKLFSIKGPKNTILGEITTSPDSKVIYVPLKTQQYGSPSYMLAYDLTGKQLWKTDVGTKAGRIDDVAVLSNGTIVVLHNIKQLLSGLDKDGNLLWTQRVKPIMGHIKASGNIIYVGGDLYDASGNLLQSIEGPTQNILYGEDGSVIFCNISYFEKKMPSLITQ